MCSTLSFDSRNLCLYYYECHFFIHNFIPSYPNTEMDRSMIFVFIGGFLLDDITYSSLLEEYSFSCTYILLVVSSSSVAPIFSYLVMSQASSCVNYSWSLLKAIKFILAHIIWMNESHNIGIPFKVFISICNIFYGNP